MEEDVAMVHLVAFFDAARLRVARVVQAAVIGQPGEAGSAGVWDTLDFQIQAAFDVHDVQRAELGTALGQTVRQQAPALGREPPIERDDAAGAQGVRVDHGPLLTLQSVAYDQQRLVQAAVTPLVEAALTSQNWRRDRARHQELVQASVDGSTLWQTIQHRPRELVLRLDPGAGFRRIPVFEPAIRIGHRHAVQDLHDVLRSSPRRLSGC